MTYGFSVDKVTGDSLFMNAGKVICLFMVMALLPPASIADHGATGKYTVGFAQDTMANDWRAAQVRQLEAAFEKHPEVQFIYTDAKGHTASFVYPTSANEVANVAIDIIRGKKVPRHVR